MSTEDKWNFYFKTINMSGVAINQLYKQLTILFDLFLPNLQLREMDVFSQYWDVE